MDGNAAQLSVAINASPDSTVRRRRPMYEALLGLEREGCAVVDRQMTHPADLALSASACCAVWTEEMLTVRWQDCDWGFTPYTSLLTACCAKPCHALSELKVVMYGTLHASLPEPVCMPRACFAHIMMYKRLGTCMLLLICTAALTLRVDTSCVQGSAPLGDILRERVGMQLARLSLAFTRCALLFEGSPGFELALVSSAEELVSLGRRSGIAVAVLTSASPEQTAVKLWSLLAHAAHTSVVQWSLIDLQTCS